MRLENSVFDARIRHQIETLLKKRRLTGVDVIDLRKLFPDHASIHVALASWLAAGIKKLNEKNLIENDVNMYMVAFGSFCGETCFADKFLDILKDPRRQYDVRYHMLMRLERICSPFGDIDKFERSLRYCDLNLDGDESDVGEAKRIYADLLADVLSDFCKEWLWQFLVIRNPFMASWLLSASHRRHLAFIITDLPSFLRAGITRFLQKSARVTSIAWFPQIANASAGAIHRGPGSIREISTWLDTYSDKNFYASTVQRIALCNTLHGISFPNRKLAYRKHRLEIDPSIYVSSPLALSVLVNPKVESKEKLQVSNDGDCICFIHSSGTIGTRIFKLEDNSLREIDPSEIGLAEVIRVADELCGIKR